MSAVTVPVSRVCRVSRMPRAGMLAGVVLVLALAGCGSPAAGPGAGSDGVTSPPGQPGVGEGTASGAASGIPDPCALLTPADIESITGFPVTEGVADPERQSEYSALCEWTQVDDIGTVTIALAPGAPVPYEEGEETALGKTVAIEIPGASEAFSVSDGLSVGMSVDGTYVSVAFSGALDGERGDVTIALATLVADRLG